MSEWVKTVIILNIRISPKKNKKEEFLQTMPALMEAALGMKGCLEAICYSNIMEFDCFLLNIMWDSSNNMKIFMESDYYKAIMGMGNLLKSKPQITAQSIIFNFSI